MSVHVGCPFGEGSSREPTSESRYLRVGGFRVSGTSRAEALEIRKWVSRLLYLRVSGLRFGSFFFQLPLFCLFAGLRCRILDLRVGFGFRGLVLLGLGLISAVWRFRHFGAWGLWFRGLGVQGFRERLRLTVLGLRGAIFWV